MDEDSHNPADSHINEQLADGTDDDNSSHSSSTQKEEEQDDSEDQPPIIYEGTVPVSELQGEELDDDSFQSSNQSIDGSSHSSALDDPSMEEIPIQITIQDQFANFPVNEDSSTVCSPQVARPQEFSQLLEQHPNLGANFHQPADSADFNIWKYGDSTFQSMLRLIDYCDQVSSSNRSFLDGFLKILAEEMKERNFNPALAPTRDTVSRKVISRYGTGSAPIVSKFRVTSISNPYLLSDHNALHSRNRDIMYCITFNVEQNILDILNDRGIFGNINNLVVNTNNPFAPFEGHGDEILAGSWYKDTVKRLKASEFGFDEFYEYLLPILLYVDKTGTTDNQRYPLEPFIFTLAIIRRALRCNARSWRPAGFIPDLESKSTYENQYTRSKNPAAIPQSYHRFLELILQGFQEVQDKGIVTWLRLGSQLKKVRIRPEIAFCIGDGKSADMITLRQGGHIKNAARISRACFTEQQKCDDVLHQCEYVFHKDKELPPDGSFQNLDSFLKASNLQATVDNLTTIAPMTLEELREHTQWRILKKFADDTDDSGTDESISVDNQQAPDFSDMYESITEEAKAKLKKNGFHPVRNAFLARCIRFGLDPRNIWGANPTDLMHAFQSGILMYLTKMALDKLGPKKKTDIDNLVDRLLGKLRSSDKESFPRYSFTKGFAKVSMITSDEWAGKLFVLLIVLNTEEGKTILGSTFTESQDIKFSQKIAGLTLEEQSIEYQTTAAKLDKKARKNKEMKKS